MIKRFGLGVVLSLFLLAGQAGEARGQYDHWELGVHGGVLWVDLFEQNTTMPVVGARVIKHFDNGWGIGPFFDYAWDDDVLVYHSYPLTDVQIYMYGLEVDYTTRISGPLYFFGKMGAGAATVELDTIPVGRDPDRLFLRNSTTRFMLAPGLGFKILNNPTNPVLAFRVDLEDRIIFNFPRRFEVHETEQEEAGETNKVNREEIANNLMLTGGVSLLLGGAPRFGGPVPLTCPPTPVCPVSEIPPPTGICVEELWWYSTDSTITVLGRNWVKFGTATVLDRGRLVMEKENVAIRHDEFQFGQNNSAVSKDQQDIFANLAVNYQINAANVLDLYRRVGPSWHSTIIEARVPQVFKEVTSTFQTPEITEKRELLREQTRQRLTAELQPYDIDVVDVFITNLGFSKLYSQAIEEKQKQVQDALRAEARVRQVEAEARQRVAEAEGDAKSNIARARGEATANRLRQRSITPRLIQWEAIQRLNPKASLIVCPPNSVCVPNAVVPQP